MVVTLTSWAWTNVIAIDRTVTLGAQMTKCLFMGSEIKLFCFARLSNFKKSTQHVFSIQQLSEKQGNVATRGMFAIPVIAAGLYNNGFSSSILKQWVKSSSDSLVDTKNTVLQSVWMCLFWSFHLSSPQWPNSSELCVYVGRHSSATKSKSCPTWPLCFSQTLLLSHRFPFMSPRTVWTHTVCIKHYKDVHVRTETKTNIPLLTTLIK